MEILSKALETVLIVAVQVLVPIALGALIMAINEWRSRMKLGKYAEQAKLAEDIIRRLVVAAEQTGLTGELARVGQEKREYVLQRAEDELAKHGITMDVHAIEAAVEACVYDEFNWKKDKPIPTP